MRYKYQYSRYTPRANTGRLIYPALTCGTGDKRPAEYKCEVKHSKLCVYRLYLYTAARYTEGARERAVVCGIWTLFNNCQTQSTAMDSFYIEKIRTRDRKKKRDSIKGRKRDWTRERKTEKRYNGLSGYTVYYTHSPSLLTSKSCTGNDIYNQ